MIAIGFFQFGLINILFLLLEFEFELANKLKSEIIEPLIYFAMYAALMMFRHEKLRGWVGKITSR